MSIPSPLDHNTTFLASGGARGITAAAVIKLALTYSCKFILLGRTALTGDPPAWAEDEQDEATLKQLIFEQLQAQREASTPVKVQAVYRSLTTQRDIRATLNAIEQAGGKAEYLSVDVTDAIALKQTLQPCLERWGPITGMIHGAGNLADKRIEKKTEQDFERVYAPKVVGLDNLLQSVVPEQLRYLVLFSSVAGFYGNAGQTDYAIANEILNKTAHWMQPRYPNCHTVAINWGPWDSGMVSPALQRAFAERGIETIPLAVGTQMMMDELSPDHREAQVVIGSPLTMPAIKVSDALRTYHLRRKLQLAANPFLFDHVIAGQPVLPATCAIAWMVHACEQLYPGYQFVQLQQFKILKGIIFNEHLADEYQLDIVETGKQNGIALATKIWSRTPTGQPRYHFSAQIQLQSHSPDVPTDPTLAVTVSPEPEQGLYQQGALSLFHGPMFQGVNAVLDASPHRLIARCCVEPLSDRQQGQFPVYTINPYIADVQSHSLWIWTQRFCEQGCLPAGMRQYEQFRSIPFHQNFYVSCRIKSQTGTAVVADVITHDSYGNLYNRMLDAKGTKLPLNQLATQEKPSSTAQQSAPC
ncbi:SDR family NAD(P)-dependent oxidoreductase [Acaryochloris sp. IP29b_bin.137]|uniref:SDR family NAD(P)-dependent oxidoreductase n=1 Tax=Acaryochloris sp. IP29b_bin.137 TaxID=2969217 RepID=UPI00262664EE|nr:SDR family NAD(P)-dependent oxidoreductase [Acaryochloris sp. IP29b_bin.137]